MSDLTRFLSSSRFKQNIFHKRNPSSWDIELEDYEESYLNFGVIKEQFEYGHKTYTRLSLKDEKIIEFLKQFKFNSIEYYTTSKIDINDDMSLIIDSILIRISNSIGKFFEIPFVNLRFSNNKITELKTRCLNFLSNHVENDVEIDIDEDVILRFMVTYGLIKDKNSFILKDAYFIMYNYKRIVSIIEKYKTLKTLNDSINEKDFCVFTHTLERQIGLQFFVFYNSNMEKCFLNGNLNYLLGFFDKLSHYFSSYYKTCKIIDIKDLNTTKSRIYLLLLIKKLFEQLFVIIIGYSIDSKQHIINKTE